MGSEHIQSINDFRYDLSVIIPCHNVSATIDECLGSVFSQTSDIEVVCIDDGSTDDTPDILKKWLASKENMVVIEQENRGSGNARNRGISVARGKYIAFMDGDDYYPSKDTLSTLYSKAEEVSAKICGGSFSTLENGRLITEFDFPLDGYVFKKEGTIQYRDYQFDYGFNRFIYLSAFLKENKITFPDYMRYQDPVFFIRAMTVAGEFTAIPECTYVYRFDKNKRKWDEGKVRDMLSAFADIFIWSKENDLPKLHHYNYLRLKSNMGAIEGFIKYKSVAEAYKCMYDKIDKNTIVSYEPNGMDSVSYDRVRKEGSLSARIRRKISGLWK